jgi:hypothetical protein
MIDYILALLEEVEDIRVKEEEKDKDDNNDSDNDDEEDEGEQDGMKKGGSLALLYCLDQA